MIMAAMSALILCHMTTPATASETGGQESTQDATQSWADIQRTGSEALDNNQYWIAEPALKQAIVAAGSFGESDLRLAKSLGELGRLYAVRGKFSDAEPYLEESLHVKELAYADDRGKVVPAMGAMIRFYLNHGTVSKADGQTEKMLDIVEGRLKEARAQTRVKFQKGVPLEAWAGVAAPDNKDELIDWAIACDAVANDYRAQNNFEMASRLYNSSLDLKETVYGKNHMSLASSYENLGGLCMEKGSTREAEGYFKDALSMTEATLPPESSDVYSRLDKLAKCYIKAGKIKDAEDLYIRAQNFWKQESSTHGEECRAAYALGSLYIDEKRYEEAAPVLARALGLAEEFSGPSSIGLVPYLQKYAYALYHLGRKPEWQELNARASTISGVM